MTPSLLDLPTEMNMLVLSHLYPAQALSMICTCKLLKEMASSHALWCQFFKKKFPTFYNMQEEQQDWKELYKKIYLGEATCKIQVYNREEKTGYFMSCFTGDARYDRTADLFTVTYPSLHVERVPHHKLRAVPKEIRNVDPGAIYIPNETSFVVGDGVELQWKRNFDAPFGWWYGVIERIIEKDLVIVFRHFRESSVWYRIILRKGLTGAKEISDNAAGGWLGNVRKVTDTEKKIWDSLMESLKPFPL